MRLVVLMIEVEQPEGLSARKLVLETAKHNVITAYSAHQGIELLKRFPKVDVAIIHTDIQDESLDEIVKSIKKVRADLPVIALSPTGGKTAVGVDYTISSHDPQTLLRLLADRYEATDRLS